MTYISPADIYPTDDSEALEKLDKLFELYKSIDPDSHIYDSLVNYINNAPFVDESTDQVTTILEDLKETNSVFTEEYDKENKTILSTVIKAITESELKFIDDKVQAHNLTLNGVFEKDTDKIEIAHIIYSEAENDFHQRNLEAFKILSPEILSVNGSQDKISTYVEKVKKKYKTAIRQERKPSNLNKNTPN